jgi:PAS domain S-box-containing protein
LRVDILKALIENMALLVVSFFFLARLSRWRIGKPLVNVLVQGSVFAACGILAILFSVEVLPGVLIDMRTSVVVVAALTGGYVVGALAAFPLLIFRLYIGGPGMIPGAGVILSALVFGLLLRLTEKSRLRIPDVLFQMIAGFGSAAVYIAWIFVLPNSIYRQVLDLAALPLCVASILSILAIFFIRNRERAHQLVIDRLTEANNLFEEISLDENIGIIVLQGTKVAYVNQSLSDKYGFSKFEDIDRDLYQIVDCDTERRIKEFLSQTLSSTPGVSVQMEITLKDGGSLHLLVHARELIYKRKKSVLVVSVDISRLIRVENTLQTRLDQLQLALDASGAVVWNAAPKEDRLTAEKSFFDTFSYTPRKDPPSFSRWIREAHLPEEIQSKLNDLVSGRIDNFFGEVSCRGRNSAARWFNIGAIARGKPRTISGILFDTTVIKEKELSVMQKEIDDMQSQKMEAIGRLAGGVAHDFNNLLHVIIGYCDILDRVSDHDPVITDVSKPIIEAADKGRELVRSLLLFSRDRKPQLQNVNIRALTGRLFKLLSRIMEENIVITSDITTLDTWVYGDPSQIEQVFMNLCVNARDAMPLGGVLNIALGKYSTVEPLCVTSGTLPPGNYAAVTVTDTGPGIPENHLKHVFEPFFTTKLLNGGTGLGLATVLGVVKEHSGYINVKNRTGRGLEITAYFPALEENRIYRQSPGNRTLFGKQAGTEFTRPVCILLAEDDHRVMTLTVEGLGLAGITVIRAKNGMEAVEIFKRRRSEIEMLVFDVMMPEMSGPEAYREIVALGAEVPVVFTTGYAGDRLADMNETHEVLNKPYAMRDLVSIIRRVTGSRLEKHDK